VWSSHRPRRRSTTALHFRFRPAVRLRLHGPDFVQRHFAKEYGDAAVAPTDEPDVTVRFATVGRRMPGEVVVVGGHKTVRWRVRLSPPEARPLEATIELRGRPRFFLVSLVQGYFVEPLLSIAAARAGEVLLPGAAVAEADGALLLVGSSGSGKSSVMARAIAAGRQVLGDDQVFLDRRACCRPFPRRLRFYWDLPHVAPAAYAALPRRGRMELRWRAAVRHATRGYVRPSLAVAPRDLGQTRPGDPRPVHRLVLVERSDAIDVLATSPVDAISVADTTDRLLERQRARLGVDGDPKWARALSAVRATERDVVLRAADAAEPQRLVIPGRWDAPRAVCALASALGLEP
jgi:hypothetical protein